MQCISPICLKKGLFVPCGKCNFCLQARRFDWAFRLYQETKVSHSAHFLTLTYNDEKIPVNPNSGIAELSKEDVQLFTKRLRKYNSKIGADSERSNIRYYTIGEYGTRTFRPHYHSIMFNLAQETIGWLEQIWGNGNVKVGEVNDATIMYTTKYHLNKFQDLPGRARPFTLISNRSGGIGQNYLNKNVWWHVENQATYVMYQGRKYPLPRYYRDKIFSPGEKEYLNMKNAKLALDNYRKSIMELKEFHHDPTSYYEERIVYAHELIKHKANQHEKL
ncbi:MAG: replication initiator protein [Microvirus sp.]|nr:MAG: replication initiator protein [Microvirus sp.]